MKNLTLLFLFVMILSYSCSDPCKDVDCGMFGSCDEGTCICLTGIYGSSCDKFYRDDFVGDWSMLTHSCDVGNSLPSVYSITSGFNHNEVEIRSSITPDFLLIGQIDSNLITIPNQVLIFGIPVEYSGSGQLISETRLNMEIVQKAQDNPTRTCTYEFFK